MKDEVRDRIDRMDPERSAKVIKDLVLAYEDGYRLGMTSSELAEVLVETLAEHGLLSEVHDDDDEEGGG